MTLSSRSARRSIRDEIAQKAGCEHPREATEPTGYTAWLEWAEEYAKTHTQAQCSKCGLWAIWTPKETQ